MPPVPSAAATRATMLPAGTFAGQVALVTGGATGLGYAMAGALSRLGATVAIASRKAPKLEAAAGAIHKETGGRVIPLECDVRDPRGVAAAMDRLLDAAGLPHIVINNAAGNFLAPSERLTPKGFSAVVDTVLNGSANVTLDLAKRCIPERHPAVFLYTSTTYAATGSGFVLPSACAKAGVECLVKSLAAEWGKHGLRFVGVAPGAIYTEGAFSRLDPTGEFAAKLVERIPAGRLGRPAEIADLVSYLVSPYANWISGEIVALDGGERALNAGQFNLLRQLTHAQWDAIEAMTRPGRDHA